MHASVISGLTEEPTKWAREHVRENWLEGNFQEVGVPIFKGLGLGFKGGCGLVYSMEIQAHLLPVDSRALSWCPKTVIQHGYRA